MQLSVGLLFEMMGKTKAYKWRLQITYMQQRYLSVHIHLLGKESDERSTAGVTTTIHLTRYLKVLQGSDSSLRVLKER